MYIYGRGVNYAHHITTCPLMDFQTFLRPYAEYIARLALTMGRMHDFY